MRNNTRRDGAAPGAGGSALLPLAHVPLFRPGTLHGFRDVAEGAAGYLIFYCPHDLVYRCFAFPPIRLMVSGMKEVTRTWKITRGVAHAHSHYKNAWMIMIVIGWARGAGSGLISNFEQLVRGVWKPETNELLKMSYPVKVSLVGAVLFTMQHINYLPVAKHNLMFFYTIFLVVTKVTMMLTEHKTSPFALFEAALSCLFFGWEPTCLKAKGEVRLPNNGTSTACDLGDSGKKKHAKKTE
uniref:Transmembrane protein 38B n=1 Tax=Salvator merianae TaxID=96440 RepID=A0A8D0E659_SALMN